MFWPRTLITDYDDLMKIEKKPICMPKVIDLPLPIDQYDNGRTRLYL